MRLFGPAQDENVLFVDGGGGGAYGSMGVSGCPQIFNVGHRQLKTESAGNTKKHFLKICFCLFVII